MNIITCLSIIAGGLIISFLLIKLQEKPPATITSSRMLRGYVRCSTSLPDNLKISIVELGAEKELHADGEFAIDVGKLLALGDSTKQFTVRIFARKNGTALIFSDTVVTVYSDRVNLIDLTPVTIERTVADNKHPAPLQRQVATGIVYDNNNMPLAGVTISVEGVGQIKSGPDGRFTFSAPASAHDNILIEGNGHGLKGSVWAGKNQQGIKLTLQ